MSPGVSVLSAGGRGVRYVTFSPDGAVLASASRDGPIRLWDFREGSSLRQLETHSEITSVGRGSRRLAFTSDGVGLVSADGDHRVRLWDIETHHLIWTMTPPHGVGSVAISRDENVIAVGMGNVIDFWDTVSQRFW